MWRPAGINPSTKVPLDLPAAMRNITRDVQDFDCIGRFIKKNEFKNRKEKTKKLKFLRIEIESTTKEKITTLVRLDEESQHIIFRKTSDYQFFLKSPWYRIKKVIEITPKTATETLLQYSTIFKKTADRKSTRLNSSHIPLSRMPSSA